jgi:molybdenum cofactor cytidylyltransferase
MSEDPVIVVLAAGKGSRFEGTSHKLVQPLHGATVLGTTLDNVLASGLPMVVVTTEALAAECARVAATRDVIILSDANAARGVAYSIAAGVAARADAPGWLVLPADMPLIGPVTLRAVADALPGHAVVFAQYQGRRGHPVGFAAELLSELLALEGDEGARRLLARYPTHAVQVDDAGILVDIDTEHDLATARSA